MLFDSVLSVAVPSAEKEDADEKKDDKILSDAEIEETSSQTNTKLAARPAPQGVKSYKGAK